VNQEKHISKALHNEGFWQHFNVEKSEYLDWTVVGIFYSAMHYIDATFAREGKHLKSHEAADRQVAEHKDLVNVYSEYRNLKQLRWKASYWSTRFSKQDIDNDIVPQFKRIKSLVLDILNK
jgi:hypothetical protein